MKDVLSCRLPCVRCDQLRTLRADELCGDCGRAADVSAEFDRRQDQSRLSQVALERALGIETRAA